MIELEVGKVKMSHTTGGFTVIIPPPRKKRLRTIFWSLDYFLLFMFLFSKVYILNILYTLIRQFKKKKKKAI